MSAPGTDRREITGIGVSPGSATGPVALVRAAPGYDPAEAATEDPGAATTRVEAALDDVAASLEARTAQAPEVARAVLEATATMARDPGLRAGIATRLAEGAGPTRAVHDAAEEFCAAFAAAGGYLAERAADLRDVRDRAIARLLDRPEPGVPALTRPSVIVAEDLAPADTAVLDPGLVRAIVTAAGGPTSHTAILAAQLGIPAVVQATGATAVPEGTEVAVDGTDGRVVVAPDPADIDRLAQQEARRAAAYGGASGPGRTRDGHRVALLVNIGTAADARVAAPTDIEGCGLFRTEFLFLGRQAPPSEDEQTETYTEVLHAFGDRPVVVRTLDAGADKPLAFADLGPEDNPALGRRGLRLSQVREDLLDTQLRALARAGAATTADLRVMAPMVATVEEAEYVATKVRAAGLPSAGIMVEVPSAALRSADLLPAVDFASIGTNDLQQYVMAADRMRGELAALLDPWQPAVLQLVQATCAGGRSTGRPVGVCGESAGDALLALVLTGLGVTSLSMAPGRVAAVRASLRLHDREHCEQLAAVAVAAPTATQARAAVLDGADPAVRDLL